LHTLQPEFAPPPNSDEFHAHHILMLPAYRTRLFATTVRSVIAIQATLWLGGASALAGDAYKWTVQYLVDTSRTVFGRPQTVSPRRNRGLAISPDYKYLYAGYHHSFNNAGEVRRIQIDVADFERGTVALLPGILAKGIATDDKGRVYICDNSAIHVYDAALETRLLRIPAGIADSVATAREGAELVLYGSDRDDGSISRWVVKENGEGLSGATLAGFGGSGIFKVPGASDLRGIKVDAKGNLWVVDLKGSKVFKMKPGGQDVRSVAVKGPMDVAIDGKRVLVTRWQERAITVLDDELNVLGNLNVPWEELELSPFGNNKQGALSGIVMVPGKGFFVSNEAGQTANQKSTYGRIDTHSDLIDGKLFRDVFQDDNEPILRATEVTTAPPP
jgi:sugar lactone lactonase YvrE